MSSRLFALLIALLVCGQSNAYEFEFKGMVKGELVHSDSAVASFGGVYSQVAPTHALRTDIFGGSPATEQETRFLESDATSFQVAQTRFSFNVSHEKVRTILEFDLIDPRDGFTNQTAIQAQGARLRLATIYYDATEAWTVFVGQKWSTASGIKSSGSFNWIGNAYRAGNSGFLAMEAGASYKKAGWSVTGAITGQGRNIASAGIDGNELGSPGIAFDVNYKFSDYMFGVAGHAAQINFADQPGFVSGENQDVNMFKAYTSLKFGSVTLNAEVYTGDGLNNQNALGIAPVVRLDSAGAVREAFTESGYFAYLNWDIRKGHQFRIGYASASVDSGDQDRLALTELKENTTAYVNYGYKLMESLTLFGQVTSFDTEYGVDNQDFSAVVARAGLLFVF